MGEGLVHADRGADALIEKSGQQFVVGSVVTLKSGGQRMTVMATTTAFSAIDGPTISCAWFDDFGKLHHEDFPLATLTFVWSLSHD